MLTRLQTASTQGPFESGKPTCFLCHHANEVLQICSPTWTVQLAGLCIKMQILVKGLQAACSKQSAVPLTVQDIKQKLANRDAMQCNLHAISQYLQQIKAGIQTHQLLSQIHLNVSLANVCFVFSEHQLHLNRHSQQHICLSCAALPSSDQYDVQWLCLLQQLQP